MLNFAKISEARKQKLTYICKKKKQSLCYAQKILDNSASSRVNLQFQLCSMSQYFLDAQSLHLGTRNEVKRVEILLTQSVRFFFFQSCRCTGFFANFNISDFIDKCLFFRNIYFQTIFVDFRLFLMFMDIVSTFSKVSSFVVLLIWFFWSVRKNNNLVVQPIIVTKLWKKNPQKLVYVFFQLSQ